MWKIIPRGHFEFTFKIYDSSILDLDVDHVE